MSGGEGQVLVVAASKYTQETQLNAVFALNRRVTKAYLLKEDLDRVWSCTLPGNRLRYLKTWIDRCAGSGSNLWRS